MVRIFLLRSYNINLLEYEKWSLKINLEITFYIGCFRGREEFKYLGVKIDKEDRQENYIRNRINKGIAITAILNSVMWNRQITRKKTNY